MTDDVRDDGGKRADRRAFLEKCGRFSVVTPPVVTLILAVSGGTEALATSAKTLTTITTTTSTTTTAPTTLKTITQTTTTTVGTQTVTLIRTVTVTETTTPFTLLESDPAPTRLAMIIDSMGLMKS